MRRCVWLVLFLSTGVVWAQQNAAQSPPPPPPKSDSAQTSPPNSGPPRSDRVQADDLGSDIGESSSKETQTDLSPPEDDAKAHPKSSAAVAEAEAETLGGKSGIT